MSKAAPDVDLQEQGIPRSTLITAAVGLVSIAVYYYTQPSAVGGGDQEEAGSEVEAEQGVVYWILSLLWMIVKLILFLFLMLLGMLVVRQRSILYCPTPPNMKRSTKVTEGETIGQRTRANRSQTRSSSQLLRNFAELVSASGSCSIVKLNIFASSQETAESHRSNSSPEPQAQGNYWRNPVEPQQNPSKLPS